MELELIRKNYCIQNFGEIYLLLRLNLLSVSEVLLLGYEKKIIDCNSERLILLGIEKENLYSFLETIKKIVSDDHHPLITCNDDSNSINLSCIPYVYWNVYKFELLLKLENLNLSTEDLLDQIAELYNSLSFPREWDSFINYLPSIQPLGVDVLYKNFLVYKNNLAFLYSH